MFDRSALYTDPRTSPRRVRGSAREEFLVEKGALDLLTTASAFAGTNVGPSMARARSTETTVGAFMART
jgi:hypothetical protein